MAKTVDKTAETLDSLEDTMPDKTHKEKTEQEPEVDYEKLLTDDEIIEDEKGARYVPIKALERLGRIKGIKKVIPIVHGIPSVSNMIAVVQINIEWEDGTISAGCADAHPQNVSGDYALYLTSMAETRAKARALRAGLGISICSQEEIATDKTAADLGKLEDISAAQIRLINKLLKENKMTLEIIAAKYPDKFANITTVEDLTKSEALNFIGWLQTGKKRSVAKKNK